VFRRKAHIYVSDAAVLDNTLRCLALTQHHGAPTRLFKAEELGGLFRSLEAVTAAALAA